MTRQYIEAVETVLREGTRKENRTGVDTISAFGVDMRFDLREGFPLLTTKRIEWFNIIAENLWFLSGNPKIDFLRKHGIKFWEPWADEDGNVPSAYGNFWRHFPVHGELHPRVGLIEKKYDDQIAWVLDELKRNPMSRRMVVSAWAPGNAQTSKLPPCHIEFILNVQNLRAPRVDGPRTLTWEDARESLMSRGCPESEPHLCMHMTQRSCDMGLGVPYNIAGYAFLLGVFAHLAGLKPGIFHHTLVDAHIYTCKPDGTMGGVKNPNTGEEYGLDCDHIPALQRQVSRVPRPLPRLYISSSITSLKDITESLACSREDLLKQFQLVGYDPHLPIKMGVAV